MFPLGHVNCWTSLNGKVKAGICLNHQFPKKVTVNCRDLSKEEDFISVFARLWAMPYLNEINVVVFSYCKAYTPTKINTEYT